MERFKSFFTDNEESAKIVAYSVAGIGLCVSVLRSRAFTRFKDPLRVPSKIIDKGVELHATVKGINLNPDVVLMVEHKPRIPLPRLSRHKYLPVKLAGIDVTPNGISWLQVVANNKDIKFIPLSKTKEHLNCIVFLPESNKVLNIGEELTKLGFARLSEIPLQVAKNKKIVRYEKSLHNAEKEAKHKRNGYWHFATKVTAIQQCSAAFDRIIRNMLLRFRAQQSQI